MKLAFKVFIILSSSALISSCADNSAPKTSKVVDIKCDCRCVEETDGLPIPGDIRLGLSITKTSLCAGHINTKCKTKADVPPGGDVDGKITSCQTVIVPKVP